jgi:hypothetical protein
VRGNAHRPLDGIGICAHGSSRRGSIRWSPSCGPRRTSGVSDPPTGICRSSYCVIRSRGAR